MDSITISCARSVDVPAIVAIHQQSFKNFFLTSLGRNFLELYYSSFIRCGEGVVYCAYRDNEVLGFSACSYISHGFNTMLIRKNILKFGIVAVHLLFTKPKALFRLAKNLNKKSRNTSVADNGRYAELYSIAVSPNCQGNGIGRLLLSSIEENVKKHNNQISLTTDYYNNDKTILFYKALGYVEYYDFLTYPNRRMWRMIKNI